MQPELQIEDVVVEDVLETNARENDSEDDYNFDPEDEHQESIR
jgi:hypothetical protein